MKTIRRIIAVTLLLFAACVQLAAAQSIESQMRDFFSYNNNQAYWWLSKFAHPTNTFRRGYCEMSGNYLYITIYSTKYNFTAKIHKNGSIFDSIEVFDDTDWAPAFQASEVLKNLALDYWRDYSQSTVNRIENIFGSLNNISSKQMCLAVLTSLLWKYPSSSSASSSSSINGTYKLQGYFDGNHITMSLYINKGGSVEGRVYESVNPNNVTYLYGSYEGGFMSLSILGDDGEICRDCGIFVGSFHNGVFKGKYVVKIFDEWEETFFELSR